MRPLRYYLHLYCIVCLCCSSSSLSSTVSLSYDISFPPPQVNGVNIEGLRHSEVVALIRAGGEEVHLLVVDQETDELFHRLGITPATSHIKGQIVQTHTHTNCLYPPDKTPHVFLFILSQRSMWMI